MKQAIPPRSCILSCTFSCVFSSSIIHVSALKHNWAFYGMQLIDKCQTGRRDKTEGQLSLRFATAAFRSVQDLSFFQQVCYYFVYIAPAFIPFARKRLLYAANFFAGTFTTAFAYVPVNACAPTFLLVSESVLIVMERSFLQL